MKQVNDVNKKTIETNFDKILNPDLTLDEKLIYYGYLYEEAVNKNNIDLQKELRYILDELKSRGDSNED